MQKTIQGLLGALPLDPAAKFYLASAADKAGHKITDALGMSKGRGTLTEGLLSDRGKKYLDAVAKDVLSQGRNNIGYEDYPRPDRFGKALGRANIIGEDANNVYIRDTYNFMSDDNEGYGTLESRGGVPGVLKGLLKYMTNSDDPGDNYMNFAARNRGGLFGAATILAPLLSYPDIDTRAPRVELAIPKQNPGQYYAPSMGLEGATPKPNPVREYFNKYVGPEELSRSDMKKYYNKDRDTYKVYQLKGEDRPTVGKGVYLDDQALKQLGLTQIPKKGQELPAQVVDALSYNRWGNALKKATEELGGTKGASATSALAEMIYQIGEGAVNPKSKKYFKQTLSLLKQGKIKEAQEEAKDSEWYRKTKNRATKVISRFGGTQ